MSYTYKNLSRNKENSIGKEVEASERFKVSIDDHEDTVALVFQHVTPGDTGMHTCVASTTSGKISCSAELTVQGMLFYFLGLFILLFNSLAY